jgi:hypothetical protein
MSPKDEEKPYRMLDDRSSATTLVFWVKNETDANDPAFINAMLLETMRGPDRTRINPLFSLALSKPSTHTSFAVFPAKQGGSELHIKCESPDG